MHNQKHQNKKINIKKPMHKSKTQEQTPTARQLFLEENPTKQQKKEINTTQIYYLYYYTKYTIIFYIHIIL